MRRVLVISISGVVLVGLVMAVGQGVAQDKKVMKGSIEYKWDGFKLGDNFAEKVMSRAPYDKPCDNDPIDNNTRRFMVYGAEPCRDMTFPEKTTMIFYLKFSEKDRYAQPIEAFAYLGGSYFADKTNFFISIGDKLEDARARINAIVKNFQIKRKKYVLDVIQTAGDVYVLHNGKVVIGLVIGPMPEDPENEQWRGLMQMYQRYTPKVD